MPKVKYQGYKKGGKVDKPYHGTTRELALRVYQKQMIGKPLKGYEKEYSKSESYKAFTKTKPYEESGHQIRGHALSEPAMEKAKRMKAAGYKLPPGLKKGGKVKEKRKGDRVYEEDYDKFGPLFSRSFEKGKKQIHKKHQKKLPTSVIKAGGAKRRIGARATWTDLPAYKKELLTARDKEVASWRKSQLKDQDLMRRRRHYTHRAAE